MQTARLGHYITAETHPQNQMLQWEIGQSKALYVTELEDMASQSFSYAGKDLAQTKILGSSQEASSPPSTSLEWITANAMVYDLICGRLYMRC